MYLPPLPPLLLLLRLLRPLSPSDRVIDAARPGQSIGCEVEFSSFEPTTFRGKFHMYANGVYQALLLIQVGPLLQIVYRTWQAALQPLCTCGGLEVFILRLDDPRQEVAWPAV